MDLAKLQKALETGPADMKRLAEEVQAKQKTAKALEAFLEAVRLLRVSWQDDDPGKYGAHWHAFKEDRKAWPRELVQGTFKPLPAAHPAIHPFDALDRVNCPSCKKLSLLVGCYQQTEDTPFGDTWMKTRYALCAACRGLFQVGTPQASSHRF